jgi:predicted phosphoribosyltransferase
MKPKHERRVDRVEALFGRIVDLLRQSGRRSAYRRKGEEGCDRELAEIERRRRRYLGDRERVDVAGRTAIVVDDGIATGATMRAALRATRMRNPKRLVLAVPVAASESIIAMREEADDVVCLEDYASPCRER